MTRIIIRIIMNTQEQSRSKNRRDKMAFYSSPEEMYLARAKRFKKDADMHWAKALNGEGDYHYGKAKKFYKEAKLNREKAEKAKGLSFKTAKKAERR